MNTFETSATVEDHGRVRVSGVPFAPGTEVVVTISLKATTADATHSNDLALAAARERMLELFRTVRLVAALDKARNTQPVSPVGREELYDRGTRH